MTKSKNDSAWEKIFEKHKLLESIKSFGHIEISSNKINEFREARLMTKFDHKSQLPKLFADNNLSILPTSRGGYIIGSFETYSEFNNDEVDVSLIEFPTFLESLDHKDITSEATAINCAFVSNILQDFTNERNLVPTVSGRMSSSAFSFNINSGNGLFNINVGNSQIEIDGGYEGDNSLLLIEAKNYISNDFLVRQLFYPYKLWSSKIQKQVRPIFLSYTNGIFHLREYLFRDANHYNSISLIRHRKYAIKSASFNVEALTEIVSKTRNVKEPIVPFPQADNFERIINLCELLKQKEFLSKEDITSNYDFDSRQTDYYSNAGKYLDLIEISKDPLTGQVGCFLTKRGKQVFSLSLEERQIAFTKLILSHSVFKQTLINYLDNSEMPSKETIVDIMKRSNLYNVNSDVTYFRRASTIVGWINWIMSQIEE